MLNCGMKQAQSIMLCAQLIWLPNPQSLQDTHGLACMCDDSETIQKLATSLSQITFLDINMCPKNTQSFMGMVLNDLTTLQYLVVSDAVVGETGVAALAMLTGLTTLQILVLDGYSVGGYAVQTRVVNPLSSLKISTHCISCCKVHSMTAIQLN